jgi:hypothetical protein
MSVHPRSHASVLEEDIDDETLCEPHEASAGASVDSSIPAAAFSAASQAVRAAGEPVSKAPDSGATRAPLVVRIPAEPRRRKSAATDATRVIGAPSRHVSAAPRQLLHPSQLAPPRQLVPPRQANNPVQIAQSCTFFPPSQLTQPKHVGLPRQQPQPSDVQSNCEQHEEPTGACFPAAMLSPCAA